MTVPIDVVRANRELAGPGKPFGGQLAFDTPEAHMGLTRLAPGASTPWHHHGSRTFFGYVIEGGVVLEHGSRGQDETRLEAGDFFRIPREIIHRDVNRGSATVLIATISVGAGPLSTPVEGPPD